MFALILDENVQSLCVANTGPGGGGRGTEGKGEVGDSRGEGEALLKVMKT
jgi:hypothetical protein